MDLSNASLVDKLSLLAAHTQAYRETGRPVHVQSMDLLLEDTGIQSAVARVKTPENPELATSDQGLYTVRTCVHHGGDMTKDLSFTEAMRLIQNRYEQSKGEVHFASIDRQE